MVQIRDDNPELPEHSTYELIEPEELARRCKVGKGWVYEHTRSRCDDPIPTVPMGKYLRFAWGSPRLEAWFQRQIARGVQTRPKRDSKQRNGGEFKGKEKK